MTINNLEKGSFFEVNRTKRFEGVEITLLNLLIILFDMFSCLDKEGNEFHFRLPIRKSDQL